MIKEADMRLSSDESMCLFIEKHISDSIIRRNQTSGHRKVGCAVGIPRLVNSASLRRKPEKELWLVTTGWLRGIWPARMGRRLNKRARSTCPYHGADGCVICQDLLSRDRKAGVYQRMDGKIIIRMSIATGKTGPGLIQKKPATADKRITWVVRISQTGFACWHLNQTTLSHVLGLIKNSCRNRNNLHAEKGLINTCQK